MNAKQNLIIDCDPGIDDSLALMLALNSPELNILGITVVCGNVPAKLGADNVFKILELTDRQDIPVFLGAEQPLKKPYISAQDTHGEDGFGEFPFSCKLPHSPAPDAAGFLLHTLRTVPKVSILALGPLTNLAIAIRRDPDSFANLHRLVSMGGSFRSHGNCSPVAEYNYWCDPHAANEVFSFFESDSRKLTQQDSNVSKLPLIEMIGLDVTRKIVLTPDILEYLERLEPKTGEFVRRLTRFYFDFHWNAERLIGCVINDPLAAAYFLIPELCTGFEAFTEIAVDGICEGQSVVDSMNFYKKRPNSKILVQVNTNRFWSFFISRLFHCTEETAAAGLAGLSAVTGM